jgi:hypothetical protein
MCLPYATCMRDQVATLPTMHGTLDMTPRPLCPWIWRIILTQQQRRIHCGACAGPVAELLVMYDNAFNPRLFVVKNYKFKRVVGLAVVFPEQVLHSSRNKTATHMLSTAAAAAAAAAAAEAEGHNVGSPSTCQPAQSIGVGQQCNGTGKAATTQRAWRDMGLHLLALAAAFACGAAVARIHLQQSVSAT